MPPYDADESIREDDFEDDAPALPTREAPDDGSYDTEDDEVDAFMASLRPAGEDAPKGEPEAATKEAPEPEPVFAGDDHVVSVKVGETEHKVPVKDLKRLFGQEASLTEKSQAVAAAREEAKAHAEVAQRVLAKAIERAEARLKPYAELDFLVLSKELDAASLKQLRDDARAAAEDVQALQAEMGQTKQAAQAVDVAATREQVTTAVETLKAEFPKQFQTDWSDEVYTETLQFARKAGLRGAEQIIDPAAIVLLRKAMLYDRGREVAAQKIKRAVEQPKRPLRNNSTPTSGRTSADTALARLRRTGDDDDAADAFMASARRDA